MEPISPDTMKFHVPRVNQCISRPNKTPVYKSALLLRNALVVPQHFSSFDTLSTIHILFNEDLEEVVGMIS